MWSGPFFGLVSEGAAFVGLPAVLNLSAMTITFYEGENTPLRDEVSRPLKLFLLQISASLIALTCGQTGLNFGELKDTLSGYKTPARLSTIFFTSALPLPFFHTAGFLF